MSKNREQSGIGDAVYSRLVQAAEEAAAGTATTPTAVIGATDRQIHRLLRLGSSSERTGLLKLLKGVGARGERVAEQALEQGGLSDDASRELLDFLADRTAGGHRLPATYQALSKAVSGGATEAASAAFAQLPAPLAASWARQHGAPLLGVGNDAIIALMESNETAADALLDTIDRNTPGDLLARLAQLANSSAARPLRKAIRSRFYRLAQSGLELPPIDDPAARAAGSRIGTSALASEAFLSAVDRSGEQAVWIIEEQPEGGHALLQAVIDSAGDLGATSAIVVVRRGRDHLLAQLNRELRLPVAPIPVEEAMGLLEEAYANNPAVAGKEYRGWRQLARADRRARRPLPLAPDPAANDLVRRSGELFDNDVCRSWLLTRAEAERAEQFIAEGTATTLVLPDHEMSRLRTEARTKGQDSVFTAPARARLAERLTRTARYLQWRGVSPVGTAADGELARMAGATAAAIRTVGAELPFIERMLDSSLQALAETREAEKLPGSDPSAR